MNIDPIASEPILQDPISEHPLSNQVQVNEYTLKNAQLSMQIIDVVWDALNPMVEEHIEGTSLSRKNTKEITLSSNDPRVLNVVIANDVVQVIPNLATCPIPTSSHVEKTKFCQGDLENDNHLGTHSDINFASF